MRTPTSVRYCPHCQAEVEASGGHCLLGHRLVAQVGSMAELRAEVDRIFDDARSEFATTLARAGAGESPPPPPPGSQPPPPPPPPPMPAVSASDPAATTSVWAGIEGTVETPHDPITAFAPGPRMDWGPERPVRRRGLFRRPSGATA